MSTRCKPGDLCIVIQGPSTGKVVRVMRAASLEEVRKSLNEHVGTSGHWNILNGSYWRLDLPVAFVDLSKTHGNTYIAYEIDDWLLPITPDAQLKAQELKEKMQ